MSYSSYGILAVVLHLIINHDVIVRGKMQNPQEPGYRYRQFLNSILVFYTADLLWGFLVASKVRALAYTDTVLFFATMALSVLLWTRYVVAFLNKKGMRAVSFLAAGWVIFAFAILMLLVNFFLPVIFWFTKETEYVPVFGRYILLVLQFLLFILISVYSFFVSRKAEGREKIHYTAVGASGGVMAVLIVLQTLAPFVPFYTIGCLIANCLIHVFVEEDERQEREKGRISAETALLEEEKARVTFNQIAESLASNYDVIYYIDIETGEYTGYTSNNIYGELKIDEYGEDFFGTAQKNISLIVSPQDQDRMFTVLDKDYLLTALEGRKQFAHQYSMIVHDQPQYTRFIARKSSDGKHMIIGVENIEEEVRREREQLRALNVEKELARRDELTGIKNKTAFTELEKSLQDNIEKGVEDMSFAIAVCDLNDLKKINDTMGHKAGDEYLVSSAKILCDIFDHSPVFRIGGDEFAVFLSGDDFALRKQLIEKLHKITMENLNRHEGPVIAVGMAEYDPVGDSSIDEIFNRADHIMYEDKRSLKTS